MELNEKLQMLRKKKGLTQQELADRLYVSRTTVSKWESGEALPELTKLPELGDVFGCKLDALLREDLAERERRYSQVRVVRVAGFRLAQYVVISPQPEADAAAHLERWARVSWVKPFFRRRYWMFSPRNMAFPPFFYSISEETVRVYQRRRAFLLFFATAGCTVEVSGGKGCILGKGSV